MGNRNSLSSEQRNALFQKTNFGPIATSKYKHSQKIFEQLWVK